MKDLNSLLKIQLIELVIAKRNDCFRLKEENKKLKKEIEMLIEDLSSDKEYKRDDIYSLKDLFHKKY